MQKINFSIKINAPVEKVWETVIGKKTYPAWTDVFCPGSDFEGDWTNGSKIKFLGPNGKGQFDGMFSEIAENKLHQFISIRHLGVIIADKIDTESEFAKMWTPAYENYTFRTIPEGTEMLVEMDSEENFIEQFQKSWPLALQKIKDLVEKGAPKNISVGTIVFAPIEKVWAYWNEPKHIMNWAFASADWEAPYSENDLKVGGKFKTTMAAKDKSASFDFEGIYSEVIPNKRIAYSMADGRKVEIDFIQSDDSIRVVETFDIEKLNPAEMQRAGWQSIIDNFKKYTESN
jgi:uncharacterized protein YndB with AHSA1/START domain